MTTVFGYCYEGLNGLCITAQVERVRRFCREHGLSEPRPFVEAAGEARCPWINREQGRVLAAAVQRGDVVVAFGGSVFTGAADLLAAVEAFRARGVSLILLREAAAESGPPAVFFNTDGEAGETLVRALGALAAMNHTLRSEAALRGILARRQQGVRYTRHPGYGFRWAGPRGRQRRVPDDDERAVMGRIVELRQANFSWHQIAATLLRNNRVGLPAGREWSPDRVRRSYFAELRLRAARL